MPEYRTEVVIAADRYVCLQLPPLFPEGRATITVHVHTPDDERGVPDPDTELDREDIEWWDEFEDGRERIA